MSKVRIEVESPEGDVTVTVDDDDLQEIGGTNVRESITDNLDHAVRKIRRAYNLPN